MAATWNVLRLATGLILLMTPAAFGQGAVPAGGELQVNSYTAGGQEYPAISRLADGGFVVVWQSDGSNGSDASETSIQGQRHDAGGAAAGPELQINSYTPGVQSRPVVAGLTDGGFVVAWQSEGSPGSDASETSIQGRRYNAAGAPSGAQFQVNTYTDDSQWAPAVAALTGGGFVVAWVSSGSSGSDDSGYSVQAQIYAADGTTVREQFQVNSYTGSHQLAAAVAGLADGGFAIAWHSWESSSDDALRSVHARVYAAGGTALGEQFQVNVYTASSQDSPALAALVDGGFVIVWNSGGSFGSDNHETSVQSRRYSASGAARGPELQVNSRTRYSQRDAAVAAEAGGGYVVVWENWNLQSFDHAADVQGQRYGPDGGALGGEFRLNTLEEYTQSDLSVTAAAGGGFVATWQSVVSAGSDTSGYSIQIRRYDVPRFALVGLDGKCLDVEAGDPSDGTPVNLYPCHGGENQRWQLDLTSTPQRVVGLDGKCLLPGPADDSGDPRVVIGTCGGPDDLWSLITGGSGAQSLLIHDQTGLCLDVEGSGNDAGTPAILFDCHGGANQLWRPAAEVCTPDSLGLCLGSERFRVDVDWRSFDGTTGTGRAVFVGTGTSGLLWFFEIGNWEMLIKVLDGCAINERLWVFAAATTTVEYTLRVTDTAVGTVREYFNPLGNAAAAITDTDAFDACPAGRPEGVRTEHRRAETAQTGHRRTAGVQPPRKEYCTSTSTVMCLSDYRFSVEVEWRDYAGNTGSARKAPWGTGDSGLFWFFDSDNWEMLVKVLNGCDVNDRFWLLAAATTDVEYTLRVTDNQTGVFREYFNPLGTAAPALVDTFETCP